MRQEFDIGESESNWLVAFLILMLSSLPLVAFFYLAMVLSGSINPLDWPPQSVFFVVYFLAMFCFSAINYREQTGRTTNLLHRVAAMTDMSEYQRKMPLDVFFSHYTNVATVGLLWGVSIYTYRSFQCSIPVFQVGSILVIAIVTVTLVGFYSVFLYKLARRLAQLMNLFLYMGLLMFVFFVDATVFEMLRNL